MTGELEGGCTCGSTRYRLKARPLFVHCCHCTWCQHETGSAFAINAMIEAREVEVTKGGIMRVRLPSASGEGQVFARCPDCGLTLWSNYAGAGDAVNFIRVGTLDEPGKAPPDIHIYTSTKLPWVVLPKDVPAVPEYYRRSEHWPAEAIARLKAVKPE
ncbi:GFA family protein [Stappia sp. F7233]|uniref:GFA family protein n=1 Tax=Stappia albiluteola TaxID=2758565 RepID=A0A839AJI9_9HYPH|nr:GFA family protein [Stappia albiluteola]MBA5779072.1 GFA family protein [Stappia albiluteola]